MEPVFAVLTGIFLAVAVYLLLSKYIIRMLLGVAILGNAVNLLIFTSGRILREVPPVIGEGLDVPAAATANPLPQALILTAIVISFSFFAFLLVLSWRRLCEPWNGQYRCHARGRAGRRAAAAGILTDMAAPASPADLAAALVLQPVAALDWLVVLPVAWCIATGAILMMIRHRSAAQPLIAVFGLIVLVALDAALLWHVAESGPVTMVMGPLAAAVRHRVYGGSHRRPVCTDLGRGGADGRHCRHRRRQCQRQALWFLSVPDAVDGGGQRRVPHRRRLQSAMSGSRCC